MTSVRHDDPPMSTHAAFDKAFLQLTWVVVILWFSLVILGIATFLIGGKTYLGLSVPVWFGDLGMFGDSFGFVTSFASLLTLLVAFRVYRIQREELEKTSKSLGDQQREVALARQEDRINEAIADYTRVLASFCVVDGAGTQWRGTDALFHIWKTRVFSPLRKELQRLQTFPKCEVLGDGGHIHKVTMFGATAHLEDRDSLDAEDRTNLQIEPTSEWVKQQLLSAPYGTYAWQRAVEPVRDKWVTLSNVSRYQMEPLLSVLLNALSTIHIQIGREWQLSEADHATMVNASDASVQRTDFMRMKQEEARFVLRHLNRFVRQLSTTELNYALAAIAFNKQGDPVTSSLAALANELGMFHLYAPGLDATEHVLKTLALDESWKKQESRSYLSSDAFVAGGRLFKAVFQELRTQ